MKTILSILSFIFCAALTSCGDGANSGNPPSESPGLYNATNVDSNNVTNRDSAYFPH